MGRVTMRGRGRVMGGITNSNMIMYIIHCILEYKHGLAATAPINNGDGDSSTVDGEIQYLPWLSHGVWDDSILA